MVIWIIGLSGAGKTVIGKEVYRQLKAVNPAMVLVDGDDVRDIFRFDGDDAFTVEGRRRNAMRIRAICAWLDRQGIDVVCCILSIFEDSHIWNRETYSEYFEVYVSAPIGALIERNPKDLYRRARCGEIKNVVGVDIPFTPPVRPDFIIENGVHMVDPEEAARKILKAANAKFRS